MATHPLAPELRQFHLALAAYNAATSLRHRGMSDDEVETVDALVEPAFATVVKSRPFSPGDIVAKGEAMIREYGETGDLAVEFVHVLLSDVRRLEQ